MRMRLRFISEFHAQRNLIREHAVGLAKYTLMGLVCSEIKARLAAGRDIPESVTEIRKGLVTLLIHHCNL